MPCLALICVGDFDFSIQSCLGSLAGSRMQKVMVSNLTRGSSYSFENDCPGICVLLRCVVLPFSVSMVLNVHVPLYLSLSG